MGVGLRPLPLFSATENCNKLAFFSFVLQAAFHHIDYEIPLRLIKLAKQAGVGHCSLLTSYGSKSSSWFLYMRTKGEMEDSTKSEKFEYTSIFQPGYLNRQMEDRSFAEKLMSKFGFGCR